jgi:membrane associated rhomboid family serine protease
MYQPPTQRFGMPPVVLNLIILNVIVYIVTNMLMPRLGPYLALYYPVKGGHFEPYQLVTYMFQHDPLSIWHLVFNMFGLWMFGTQIELVWGSKKFLLFYLVCGLGAGAFNLGIDYIRVEHFLTLAQNNAITVNEFQNSVGPIIGSSMIGASGAIFGVLAAFAMLFPNQMMLLLFFPVPIKAKYFVIGYAALELYNGIAATNDHVAHFAHLGGGITGLIILLIWKYRGTLFWRDRM